MWVSGLASVVGVPTDGCVLCFKLHKPRTAVVSSTAAATLRQLFMFVVDKVVELESITLPDGKTQILGPAVRDALAIFEDLCLIGNSVRKFPTAGVPPQNFRS